MVNKKGIPIFMNYDVDKPLGYVIFSDDIDEFSDFELSRMVLAPGYSTNAGGKKTTRIFEYGLFDGDEYVKPSLIEETKNGK